MNEGTAAAPGPPAICAVHLDSFRGPVDLLIHLARAGELDVTTIPILEVARQYEDYLNRADHLDLDVAGDSLVSVATLVYLKSRRLLPLDRADGEELVVESALAVGGPAPARHALREAAAVLQEREALMELAYPRPADLVAEYAAEQGIEADLFSLLRAFQAILRRVSNDPAARITRERVSLVERMNWLLETLRQKRRVGFQALFEGVTDRVTCILTFLALLEVIRLRLVRALQSHRQEDILILLPDDDPPPAAVPDEALHA